MKPKDRITAAIRHEEPDRIPWGEIFIDDAVIKSFLQCKKVTFDERMEFAQSLRLDLICQAPSIPILPGSIALPEPSQTGWGDLDNWAAKSDSFIFILLDGAFEWGIKVFGIQKFLVSLMRGDAETTSFIRAIEVFNIELMRQAFDRGAMAVLLADDIAYQRGLMADPVLLKRYILPSIACLVEAAMPLGLPVFFHSDGNLTEILPGLAGSGIAGLHSLEAASGMDLGMVKKAYGGRLCLWGGFNAACLTSPYSREIAEQIEPIIITGGEGWGFIFGSSSGLYKGVRPENLRSVRTALDKADHAIEE